MAEIKVSLHVLLKLLAHFLMTALFVIAVTIVGVTTTIVLQKLCGASHHVICREIRPIFKSPLLIGINVVVCLQVIYQTADVISTIREAHKWIARARTFIPKRLADWYDSRASQKRA